MTQVSRSFHSRRSFLFATTAVSLASCARESTDTEARQRASSKVFKMGERASVGLVTYNVLEASYVTQLGEAGKAHMPENRFLLVRMSITNGGAKEAELPLFRLVDDKGKEYSEVQNAEFVPGWFGIIRKVGPTQTEEGRILFDVSPRTYKLEVTDGGESGKEQIGFIEIPIDFDTTEPVPTGAGQAPSTK